MTATANLVNAYYAIMKKGGDPRNTYFVDIEASAQFSPVPQKHIGCITASRGSSLGWWITSRARKISMVELFRFQGLNLHSIRREGVSNTNLGKMAGNAMSSNALERVLARALFHAGLVQEPIKDIWERPLEAIKTKFFSE